VINFLDFKKITLNLGLEFFAPRTGIPACRQAGLLTEGEEPALIKM
jgi:hypothetical protein